MGVPVSVAWRPLIEQTMIVTSASSQQSAAFGPNTYCIRLAVATSVQTDGAQYSIGKNPTATINSPLIPAGWVEYIRVAPGEKVALIQNGGSLDVTITEMTH